MLALGGRVSQGFASGMEGQRGTSEGHHTTLVSLDTGGNRAMRHSEDMETETNIPSSS